MPTIRNAILWVLLATLGTGLAACGTVRGAGQDIQSTGTAIKRAAS